MQRYVSKLTPELRVMLRLFQIVALLGLGHSIMTLAGGTTSKVDWLQMLYTTWFALAVVSIEAILYQIRAGVITLVIATLAVAIAELLAGVATIGGASLGLLVFFIVVVYIRPIWKEFD
ncbi:MAG: hypothetical protein ACOCX3_00485 [Chloroflexota bacterium]